MTEQFISLAELAGTTTDDVLAITTRVPAAGIYCLKGLSITATQTEATEERKPLTRFAYANEILDMLPTDKKVDKEKLIGRKLNRTVTLWPDDLAEGIGFLKGDYEKAGIDNTGNMGGVEGSAPGWLDNIVGATYFMRVNIGKKNGQDVAYFDVIPTDAGEKAFAA